VGWRGIALLRCCLLRFDWRMPSNSNLAFVWLEIGELYLGPFSFFLVFFYVWFWAGLFYGQVD